MGRNRLCYITNDLEMGGVQRLLFDLCSGLLQRGWEIDLITVCGEGEWLHHFTALGVNVYYVPCLIRLGRVTLINPPAVLRLSWLIRSRDYRIVHCHLFLGNLIGRIAASLARVSVVIATEHNTYLEQNVVERLIDRMLLPLTTSILAVSDAVVSYKSNRDRIPCSRFHRIYNGINQDLLTSQLKNRAMIRQQLGVSNDTIVLGTVSRLVPQKNPLLLLEAYDFIQLHHPKSMLLVVGDGSEREKLRRAIGELGLSTHVHLVGKVSTPGTYLAAMDLFITTPRYEGFGLVVAEAMACGLPVVATAVGGLNEVVANGITGVLVQEQTPEAVANAALAVLKSREKMRQMGLQGRKRVEQLFTTATMVRQYHQWYSGLVSN